jgi:L-ribulose-5-phosphate 3-epimerase
MKGNWHRLVKQIPLLQGYLLKNKIGVMQGRLLPKYKGRYQAHPVGYWEQEFELAQNIDLDYIEFILDFNDAQKNPLLENGGVDKILSLTDKTGVSVKTVCADYFMKAPLHSEDELVSAQSQKVLTRLLRSAAELGVTDVVIPCVDTSSLLTEQTVNRFVDKMKPCVQVAEKKGINLSLETDLPPRSFLELLGCFDSEHVTVNYDIGNSAALGYDSVEEFEAYGNRITDVHIKDRELGGGPVILGEGVADFDMVFSKLSKLNYQGPFIMQAYRDEGGIDIFNRQLDWVKPYLDDF